MLNSIVKKIFLTIVGIFVLVMFIQLVLQNFFLEDIYSNMKISKIEKSFEQLCEDYNNHKWTGAQLNQEAMDYQNENGASILILNENDEVLNESFFKGFNYITIRDSGGKELKIIIDFLIDEEGNFRNLNNKIKDGESIEVIGMSIKGTNFIDPLEIKKMNTSLVSDEGYATWDELYKKNPHDIVEISGEVIARNFVVRDQGVLSYQQEKLFNEVKRYLIEKSENPQNVKEIFKEGSYEFTEEYSGLLIVVLAKKVVGADGNSTYAFSLFTLENIHDAFQILNGYYYYIFIFQLALVLVLVYFYSKWITNPLIKLIDSAKSISELNFTKRTDISTNDELSILSDSLNNISNNLSTAIEKLESSNEQLAIEAIKKAENEERMRNLLASLSHEFKTPLGIISGFLEIISDGVYEKEPEYYINVISDEIDKLNGLVLETIELSELETGSYKLNVSEFEIKPFIEVLMSKFEKQFEDKSMSFELGIEDRIVIGDISKIEQVMINILSNGVRYSPNGERIEVTSELQKDNLYVYIRNYGVLIDSKDLDKIWDRFYRAEKSRNRSLGGSGLGLTIVKNILELHESDYSVKNINNGVEFYFSLKMKY
ncbi:sensor histidine kinase [Tepidibacter hydrothermalis]|uniref:histidine kinase n=1 Tax=Tepidibacter hydrothermalis TaxID=3036126 RepID=A0ABY8EFP0_9FIRM|nr:HAMP domain-containing sensor histidine kinase [Tepidibacter hydrothermalis]WFD11768.1 HAMP domain-containing sensor histidine kinase [Tepidibacter hydrothermalis]